MNEKRVVTVKCPTCGTLLQVKTRSAEKVVGCPKCGGSMTVSAAPAPALAPAQLPFAMKVGASPPPLPMAEPLAALPMAEPLRASPRLAPRHVAIAGGIGGAVLVGVVLLIAFRPGEGQSNQPTAGSGGSVVQSDANAGAEVTGPDDGATSGEQTAASADQGENLFDALSNAQIKEGGNNAANNFPQGGFPQGGGFPSVGNNQQRNWDLANGGRLGAMGLKKVQPKR